MTTDPKLLAARKRQSDIDRALRKNHRKTLRRLITKEGCNPHEMMYRALEVSHPETVRLLIELGYSVDAVWVGGHSALHQAVLSDREDRVDLCRVLVGCGADPMLVAENSMRSPGDQERDTPFQRACRWDRVDLMRFFVVECGIDPTKVRTETGKFLFKTVSEKSRGTMLALKTEYEVSRKIACPVDSGKAPRAHESGPL